MESFYLRLLSLSANNLRNAFVFVCLNRFQQVVNVHTFQAQNESSKVNTLRKLNTAGRFRLRANQSVTESAVT